MSDTCPLCASDLTGDPIPQEYIDAGYYAPGSTHYSRLIGHEVSGFYDGTAFWSCPDCLGAWPRFTDGRRAARSAELAAEYTAAARTA